MRGIKHRVSNIKREYLESLQVDVDKGSLLIQVPSRSTCNVSILGESTHGALHSTPNRPGDREVCYNECGSTQRP